MFKTLRQIHDDEKGMETLQVVMIIALAAVILFFIKAYWPKIQSWLNTATSNITGSSTDGNGGGGAGGGILGGIGGLLGK